MTKRAKVLKPDTILKNYWKDNGRFADLFNAVLFDGKPFIKPEEPEELDDADTDESSILEHREFVQSIQASRDIIKTRKKSLAHGVEFVLLRKESQEHIHYAIPLRVMGYDYSTYKKQYDANARKYKASDGMTADEYLSRMKRTDKFYPVITHYLRWKFPKTKRKRAGHRILRKTSNRSIRDHGSCRSHEYKHQLSSFSER